MLDFVITILIMSKGSEKALIVPYTVHLTSSSPTLLGSLSSTFFYGMDDGWQFYFSQYRLGTSVCFPPPCMTRGPKEQDELTHVDRWDDGWGRAGHRPTGPKGESGLNWLLPEAGEEGRSGAKPCGRSSSFRKQLPAMSRESSKIQL